jgi:hypothetical protein
MEHHLAEERRDFQTTSPDQALVGPGLEIGVDLIDPLLK